VDVVFQPEIEGLNDKMVVALQEGKLSRIRLIISIFWKEIIKENQCISNNFLADECF